MAEHLRNFIKTEKAEGDYEKNGLLHCGKCNTPKQRWLTGKAKELLSNVAGCECSCQRTAREEREAKDARYKEQMELITRREIALANGDIASTAYLQTRFKYDKRADSELSKSLKRYVENFAEMKKKGIGIMFYGEVGTGKTFYASCIANAVFDKGYSVVIDTYANLCNRIQDFGAKRDFVLNQIRYAGLVVFDDFGAERQSDYVQEKGFTLIDEREKSNLPMIITTNLTPGEIKKSFSKAQKRIYSRIMKACVPLHILDNPRPREAIGKEKTRYFQNTCGGFTNG